MQEPEEATGHPDFKKLKQEHPHRLITDRFIGSLEDADSSRARHEGEAGHDERYGHQV